MLNIVNGFGVEAGKPLASSARIAKIAFTGETTTGRLIMQYASQNLIPVTLELGGKSPNIFFDDVMAANDDFLDKALEGFTMFALNQGEVCTCPSRALIQQPIYDEFLEQAVIRTKAVKQGDPLDTDTMIGAQASNDQLEKILSYIDIGKQGGRQGRRPAASAPTSAATCPAATTSSRRSSRASNDMRIFQEEIFGPVVSVTSFDDYDDGHRDRQRHPLRARRRRLDARRQHRLPRRARHQGRPGLDELLPPLPGPRRVRWVQAVRRSAARTTR